MSRGFDYQALNPANDEIRLLDIKLATSPEDTLSCQIRHVPLASAVNYTALSYTWDQNCSSRVEILVNDQPVDILPNLAAALLALKNGCRSGPLAIWADALCINQNDLAERTQQLRIMREIYVRAKDVCVWLGPSADDSDFVCDELHMLGFAGALNGHAAVLPAPDDLLWKSARLLSNPRFAEAIWCLLRRPYWRRCWIIQELAVNSNVVLKIGESALEWGTFTSVISALSTRLKVDEEAFNNIRSLQEFRTNAQAYEPTLLLRALCRSVRSQASQPRDRVFALLGIVDDARHIMSLPDYKRSLEDLNMEMLTRLILQGNNLNIIPMLCNLRGPGDSSWIPQLFSLSPQPAERTLRYWDLLGLLQRARLWDATRGTACEFKFEGSALLVKGQLVDKVVAIADGKQAKRPFSAFNNWLSSTRRTNRTSLMFSSENRRTFVRILRCLDLLKHFGTISAQREQETGMVSKYHANTAAKALGSSFGIFAQLRAPKNNVLHTWVMENQDLPIEKHSLKSWLFMLRNMTRPLGGSLYSSEPLRKRGEDAFKATLAMGDRFFVTKRTDVGWCPPEVQRGDKIYLLSGCSVPVIARPRANGSPSLQMVSGAWVEDLMRSPWLDKGRKTRIERVLHSLGKFSDRVSGELRDYEDCTIHDTLPDASEWPVLRFE